MDDLEISGKLYISSKKAAKQNKYHVDYIGQLVRTGKIVGTKVGRAWYVEADSLAAYLGQEPEPKSIREPVKQAVIAEETTDLQDVQLPAAFSRRIGLTYLSDSTEPARKPLSLQPLQKNVERKGISDAFSVPIHTHANRMHTEPEVAHDRETNTTLQHSSQGRAGKTFLAFLGKLFFGVAAGGAFAALLGASYFFSYQSSVGGVGQAANIAAASASQ